MLKVPLYFNYIGSRRDMLDRAMESYDRLAGDIVDVRCLYNYRPRHFTECLNEILAANDNPYFFAHYDSILEDRSAIERLLEYPAADNIAIIGHSEIVDLLMLVRPHIVRQIGGWDTAFKNSMMDLDLYCRLHGAGLGHIILNPGILAGNGVSHDDASKIRVDPKIFKVYAETMIEDLNTYYDRYHGRDDAEYARLRQHIADVYGV